MNTHRCDLLAVSCIDYRFQEPLRIFLNGSYYHNYDLICLAGSVKNIISPDKNLERMILQQIKISSDLHQIKKIFLFNHQDCGAYGSNLKSGGSKERAAHQKDLFEAKMRIKKLLPTLEIFTYFIEFKSEPFTELKFSTVG